MGSLQHGQHHIPSQPFGHQKLTAVAAKSDIK